MNKAPERSRGEILSENICYLIELNKTSEKQIVEETGLKRSALSSWICKKHIPRDDNLKVLADYFKTTVAELYTDRSTEGRRRSYYTIAQKTVIQAMEDDPVFNAFVLEALELRKNEHDRLVEYLEMMKNPPDSGGNEYTS